MRLRWLLLLLALPLLAACHRTPPPPYKGGRVDHLIIKDQVKGTGAKAEPGMDVTVDYTGWLYDKHAKHLRGKKFDSTADRSPLTFEIGGGRVIKGWEKGLVGMRVGGVRELLIPPDLAYGDRGAGSVIPPGASLVFEVKLLKVQKAP